MIGGAEIQNQMITRKLDTVLALESNFSNRLCLFEIANTFVTNMLPENMTYVLRMVWSMGQGGNDSVMQNQEGTDLSSTGEYIEKLVSRSSANQRKGRAGRLSEGPSTPPTPPTLPSLPGLVRGRRSAHTRC